MLYENTRIAVKEIAGSGERRPTEAFGGFQSHYLFEAKFGRPGKGNDKGDVEGLVGYARRNFLVPMPRVTNNLRMASRSQVIRSQVVWGTASPIMTTTGNVAGYILGRPSSSDFPFASCAGHTLLETSGLNISLSRLRSALSSLSG
jgi:hypothetical protein